VVVVVPLKEGPRERAMELVDQGPPFDVELTHLERHEMFLSDNEAIFDFETPGGEPPIKLDAEGPALHEAAKAGAEVMAGSPRKAVQVFSWDRGS
jgi:hypothetical protein